MNTTQQARQVILDLLAEYRELETPANPELLKLHIDAATDRLDTIYAVNGLVGAEPLVDTNVANKPNSPTNINTVES